MNVERIKDILSHDEKCDVFYNERIVWIQGLNNNIAKIGFIDNFEEKNVPINDLYEKE